MDCTQIFAYGMSIFPGSYFGWQAVSRLEVGGFSGMRYVPYGRAPPLLATMDIQQSLRRYLSFNGADWIADTEKSTDVIRFLHRGNDCKILPEG